MSKLHASATLPSIPWRTNMETKKRTDKAWSPFQRGLYVRRLKGGVKESGIQEISPSRVEYILAIL